MDIKTLHNQINTKLYDRNVPSHNLQPYLDVRPVATKYVVMPLGDQRPVNQMIQQPTYTNKSVFNPGDSAPWSGFNVNLETDLRIIRTIYAPDSKSDLYQYNFKPTTNVKVPHELLFKNEPLGGFNPNPDNKNANLFNNSTRDKIPL